MTDHEPEPHCFRCDSRDVRVETTPGDGNLRPELEKQTCAVCGAQKSRIRYRHDAAESVN